MGKKGGWFSAVKKALSSDSKYKKDQLKNTKSEKWFAKGKDPDCPPSSEGEPAAPPNPLLPPHPPPQHVDEAANSIGAIESDLDKRSCSDALPPAANADAVPLRNISRYSGKSEEEIAAIRIQTVFRGFLARRALRALRGLERLKTLIEGQSVKQQSSTTLKCMQNLAHLQSQIRARRIRMSEENQALHRQLQQKHEKELERLRMGKEWNDSTQSKEQMEANLQNKQDAATRRERALAYSYSHQTKKNSRSVNPSFMDPNNPHWGWSWLERWMASRPWETRSTDVTVADKDCNDHAPSKSTISRSLSVTGEKKDKLSPTSSQKAGRPPSRQPLSSGPSSNPQSRSTKTGSSNSTPNATADDSRSRTSVQSQRYRRHSSGGVPARDDESLASSSPAISYMTPTKSTKARTKPASPLGISDHAGTSEKGSVKKRLSFPATPPSGPRRHSVPGKIEGNSAKNGVNSPAE